MLGHFQMPLVPSRYILKENKENEHFLGLILSLNQFIFTQTMKFELKIVREYDQEIPQSQTADNPVAPRGRAVQPSRDTRQTN